MAESSLLTHLRRPGEPKWLWPVLGVASVLLHGLALGMVRSLSIEIAEEAHTSADPLPIQLVTLPPAAPGTRETLPPPVGAAFQSANGLSPEAANPTMSAPADSGPAAEVSPVPTPTPATAPSHLPNPLPPRQESPVSAPPRPTLTPSPLPETAPPQPQAAPSPQAQPSPVASIPPTLETVSPGAESEPVPPTPTSPPPVSPSTVSPRLPNQTTTESAPFPSNQEISGRLDPVPTVEPDPAPATEFAVDPQPPPEAGQGGQITASIRPNPAGRDIPEVAPRLSGGSAISVQPLPPGCTVANLPALVAAVPTARVRLQIMVEANGDISAATVVPGGSSGNASVDGLVSCLVRDKLSLLPAYSGGAPIKSDAFILDAQVSF